MGEWREREMNGGRGWMDEEGIEGWINGWMDDGERKDEWMF